MTFQNTYKDSITTDNKKSYKGKDKLVIGNYRLISLLPTLSKFSKKINTKHSILS